LQAYEVFGIRPVTRTNVKNVTFYVMSSNDDAGLSAGNFWSSQETFPAPEMTKFFLHADGTASTSSQADGEGPESTTYTYDPANPVPTVGGNNLDMPCGPLDQAEVDQRADVLTFQTPAMDTPLYLTGPLFANLFVGSDAVDTDFMVRLCALHLTVLG
jgi:uncharacterized protein